MLASRTKSSLISIQLIATLLVALSGVLYGFLGFLGTKVTDDNISISTMLFWRFFIALLWIVSFTLLKKEKISIGSSNKKTLLSVLIFGSIFYSGGSAFYFLASENAGTGLAMVIFFCYPVFVALFAWVTQRSKINVFSVTSLLAIIIGLMFLKGRGDAAVNLAGIIYAVAAALFYGSYVISSKFNADALPSNLLTITVCLGNTVIFLILSLATKSFAVPDSLNTWLYILALGIFATAVPIQLLLDGLRHVSSLKASILSVLEPVVTLIVGVIFLSETVSSLQIFGVFVVLCAAILIQFER